MYNHPTMRAGRAFLLIPLLIAVLTLGACKSSGSTGSTSAATGGANSSQSAGTTCPTSNTKSFAKTKFVYNIGLIAGTFHRYIYKPYQAGTFKKGAHGRTLALIKAAGTAVLIVHELKEADQNVNASPALCKTLKAPLSDLSAKVSSIADKIKRGDVSDVAGANTVLGTVTGALAKQGLPVKETSK